MAGLIYTAPVFRYVLPAVSQPSLHGDEDVWREDEYELNALPLSIDQLRESNARSMPTETDLSETHDWVSQFPGRHGREMQRSVNKAPPKPMQPAPQSKLRLLDFALDWPWLMGVSMKSPAKKLANAYYALVSPYELLDACF